MNLAEFEMVKGMTYLEYCDYLQNKYGIGLTDYMTLSFNKNPKVSRTAEGLYVHHKAEDKAILLSKKEEAMRQPFEWQKKDNLVYCDYLEHLLLHVLICKYPSPDKISEDNVGIGGITVFMIPELNDLYSGWEPKQKWLINCYNVIKDDIVVYIEILKMFIDYLKNELDYHERGILYRSANEKYGTWSSEFNIPLYLVMDQLWD